MATITITYGERVENHVGNQQIGDVAESGLSAKKLKEIKKKLEKDGYECKYIKLNDMLPDDSDVEEAGILIVRNFIDTFFDDEIESEIYDELVDLKWDKKALMKGIVKNKHARWNLCFANFSQKPDYENGKGRVYKFSDVKNLLKIKKFLEKLIKVKLNAEGNYYYDITKCYIGYHGDTERKIVIAIRFGDSFPMYFKWFKNSESVSDAKKITLNGGDLYIMSQKTSGFDWKKRSIYTLRHGAGKIEK